MDPCTKKSVRRIAIILALIFCLNYAAAAAEKRPTPPKREEKTDLRGTDSLPLSIKLLPTTTDKDELDRQEREANEKADADAWMVRLTGLIALIGAFQLCVFISQKYAFDRQASSLNATVEEMKAATEISRRQWVTAMAIQEQNKRALEIAKSSADAAELTAKAAISTELPFLNIESIDSKTVKLGLRKFVTAIHPKIKIKNYGRTPAFVDEIIVNISIDKAFPPVPEYTKIDPYPEAYVIEPNGTLEYTEFDTRGKFVFSDKQVELLETKEGFLIIYGVINFSDFFGNRHQKGFIFSLINGTHDFGDMRQILPNYNFQRQNS